MLHRYGFYSGAVSAMLGSGGAWWAQRSVFITPEPVYKAAFRAVYKDSNAVKALGGGRIKNVGDIQGGPYFQSLRLCFRRSSKHIQWHREP